MVHIPIDWLIVFIWITLGIGITFGSLLQLNVGVKEGFLPETYYVHKVKQLFWIVLIVVGTPFVIIYSIITLFQDPSHRFSDHDS